MLLSNGKRPRYCVEVCAGKRGWIDLCYTYYFFEAYDIMCSTRYKKARVWRVVYNVEGGYSSYDMLIQKGCKK